MRLHRVGAKNSQLAPAQRVVMKMGRRLRCSSVYVQVDGDLRLRRKFLHNILCLVARRNTISGHDSNCHP
jgi:hypothetical protein